jgi:hypothetical protein
MSKTLLSLEELKDRAFQAIKRCECLSGEKLNPMNRL